MTKSKHLLQEEGIPFQCILQGARMKERFGPHQNRLDCSGGTTKMSLRWRLPFVLFASILLLLVVSLPTQAQQATSNDLAASDEKELLRELINEVRQLRLALQRANLNSFRAQVAIERLKTQQLRVDNASRQLEENQSDFELCQTIAAPVNLPIEGY